MDLPENPQPTPEMRESARQAPGTWIYVVDPAFQDAREVPPSAIVGAYGVDDRGEIGDEFTRNPNYRPSALAWGFPPPANELEGALQNAVTGNGDDAQVRAALLDATVFTRSTPKQVVLPVQDDDLDLEVVQAFTSERYLSDSAGDDSAAPAPVAVREIAPALRGRYLLLNPGSQLEVRLPGDDLVP
jgi:hypothetical protein